MKKQVKRSNFLDGFSRESTASKIEKVASEFEDAESAKYDLESFLFTDSNRRRSFLEFSENTISSYHLPYGVVPNLLLDGELFHVPFVTEESSVVAAASASAKFWYGNGGFSTLNISTTKVGQVHFSSSISFDILSPLVAENEPFFKASLHHLTEKMEERGGGIASFQAVKIDGMAGYFYLLVEFETVDSMGANFINTCLEELSVMLKNVIEAAGFWCNVLMAILSNYTPNCVVTVGVSSPISSFSSITSMDAQTFALRFKAAVDIAEKDIYRATTHNKGIMNGVDGVVIATGNDFRAVEAASHAYAVRSGRYKSLSKCYLNDGLFRFELTLPLALGVVGGLTSLHPLAKRSLELLGNPSSKKLMSIVAAVGLASNFAAIKSLISDGIQQGHMKMHLNNILMGYNATDKEVEEAQKWFTKRKVSQASVKSFLDELRS